MSFGQLILPCFDDDIPKFSGSVHDILKDKIDWYEVFSTVVSVSTKNIHILELRSYFIELTIAEYSNGYLEYVGYDTSLGHDFITHDGYKIELKTLKKMFNDKKNTTESIILKNSQGENETQYNKVYDYMLLIDTEKFICGLTNYENVLPNIKIGKANITAKIPMKDIDIIVSGCDYRYRDIPPVREIVRRFIL